MDQPDPGSLPDGAHPALRGAAIEPLTIVV
jgi:hypothetical protein